MKLILNYQRYDNHIENYQKLSNNQQDLFIGINFQIYLNKVISMINNLQKNPKDENEFDIRVLLSLPKNQKDEYSIYYF